MLCTVLCVCWRGHILVGSAGVNCEGGNHGDGEENQLWRKLNKRRVQKHVLHIYTGTWYLGTSHHIPGTAVCSKESTAQHETTPHRRARDCTAQRCAAVSHISLWAELSLGCIFSVIQQSESSTSKHSPGTVRHSAARHRTVPHRTAGRARERH